MNFSYWEYKTWLSNVDFTIVGSGIVGLSCALRIKERFPESSVLILEKGMLPSGASTKNAGFACFGSLSEILDDFQTHSEEEIFQLVQKRYQGLLLLRKNLGDQTLEYLPYKGYELFTQSDKRLFESCLYQLNSVNQLLFPIFKAPVFSLEDNSFDFKNIMPKYIVNQFEGQLDTGKMIEGLLSKVQKAGIKILNACAVESFDANPSFVEIQTTQYTFRTSKLLIATNGFASQLGVQKVQPARAQVLITKPIKNLRIRGTFHLDKGYYYFRNIDNRILLGGGRNLDVKGEETTEFGQTTVIQQKLEKLLREVILPGQDIQIDHRWSGIMGVGPQKKAIVKQISERVFCGVRLGGMGVAIGSIVGTELADLL